MHAIEDIEPFQDVLPLKPRETALSYVSRLAAFHGCLSANDFCLGFGLTMLALTRGEPTTMLRLAALSGANYDDLCRWSPKAISQNRFSINGEVFEIRKSPRSTLRICPECARSDIASNPDISADLAFYGRAEWAISAIRMCPVHSVFLAHFEMKPVNVERVDFLTFTGAVLARLESLTPASAQWSDVEAYVMGRICGSPVSSVPMLDDMALGDALGLCQSFGADYLQVTERLRDLEPELAHRCRQIGFAAFKEGKDGLLAHIGEMRDKVWRGGTLSPQVLGKTLNYLSKIGRSDATSLVKRTVAEAVFATLPYAAGDSLIGIVCERRSLHTYESMRLAYDLRPVVLDAFCLNHNSLIVHRGANRRDTLFDYENAEVLFGTRAPLVGASTLWKHLGLSQQFFSEAVAGGLIEPIRDDALRDISATFSLPQVEGHLARVAQTWRRLETRNAKMVSLADACNQSFVFSRRVFALLNQGRLTNVGYVDAASKLAGLRLDPDEVLSIDSGVGDPMTITDVAYYIRTQQNVVRALTERHFLPAVEHSHGRNKRRIYDRRDVESFVATYATSTEMARAVKMPIKTRAHLERMSIFPAILLGDLGQFYRRSDLDTIVKR